MKRRRLTEEEDSSSSEKEEGEEDEEIETLPQAKLPNITPSQATESGAVDNKIIGGSSEIRPGKNPLTKITYVPVIGKELEKTEKINGILVRFLEKPKKRPNSFFLYMKERRQKLLKNPETKSLLPTTLTKIIAKEWNEMSIQSKRKWILKSQEEKELSILEDKRTNQEIKYSVKSAIYNDSNLNIINDSSNNNNNNNNNNNDVNVNINTGNNVNINIINSVNSNTNFRVVKRFTPKIRLKR